MGKRDPSVDTYIESSADFAKPILNYLRETVHAAVPDVEEAMKWSFPHFMYKGMLCSMASFKQHCAFGFWKGSLVLNGNQTRDAMGHLGRITTLRDLPSKKALTGYIREAAALNDQGVKVARQPMRATPRPLNVPTDLAGALEKNKQAKSAFDAFPPSHKREYVEWITDAKSDDTRTRRLTTAIEWMAKGKSRNWKYER